MFHKNIKLILAAFIIGSGIWSFTDGEIGNGIFFLFLSLIPILAHIKNPESALVRKQQGYFNYLHGIMLSQTNLIQAEKYFKKAIELGLSMDMDLAVAKLNLAGVAMTRRRKLEATTLLNEAKKLDKQNMLKDQIVMMKEQLKKM